MKLENAFLRVAVKAIEKNAVTAAGRVSNNKWFEPKVPKKLLEKQNKDA